MALTYDYTTTPSLAPSPKSLSDLRLFTVPEGGTDRLTFRTWDTIAVQGVGEDTVELRGHYVIERARPDAADWVNASIEIRMRELEVAGVSRLFGPVRATVNYAIGKPSQGRVHPGTLYPDVVDSPKMCTMEGYMRFELPAVGMTVFNKEAIVLQHNITHIPPVGQGGGTGDVAVDLYDSEAPDAPAVAVLKRVKTHIGAWQRQVGRGRYESRR